MAKVLINSAAIRKKDLVVVDGDLNVVEDALISVIDYETGSYALIYDPLDKNTLLQNPFQSDDTGQFAFWVESGIYKVMAVTQTDTEDLQGEVVIDVSKDNEINTPEDFGAAGDGVTDDSVALNQFFNSDGGYITPGKEYYFTDTIIIENKSKQSFFGSGVLKAEVYNKPVIDFKNCNYIVVDGIHLDMTGIKAELQDVKFQNGLVFRNCKNGILSNSTILGSPSQALNVRDACDGFKVTNNKIIESGRLQQLNPSGISIGGAILVFNSKEVEVTGNYINRSWSACIFFIGDDSNQSLPFSPIDNCVIANNIIYESQSNGIRIQPDNYPDADLTNNCVVEGNIVMNCGRTLIRTNGNKHVVTGNIAGWDGKPIYDDPSDIPNSGWESNHCKDVVVSNNIFFNAGSGVNLNPNSLGPGVIGVSIESNKFIDNSYNIIRTGTELCRDIKIIGNDFEDFEYSHIDIRDINDVTISGKNKFKGFSSLGVLQPTIFTKNCLDITIDGNEFEDCNNGGRYDNTSLYYLNNNLNVTGNGPGINARTSDLVRVCGNQIRFNSEGLAGKVGVTVNAADFFEIKNNYIESVKTNSVNDSAVLISGNNQFNIINNTFTATNAINTSGQTIPYLVRTIAKNLSFRCVNDAPSSQRVYRASHTMTQVNEVVTIPAVENFENAILTLSSSSESQLGSVCSVRGFLISNTQLQLVRGSNADVAIVTFQVLQVD